MNMQAEGLPKVFPETSQSLKEGLQPSLIEIRTPGALPQAIDEKGLQP